MKEFNQSCTLRDLQEYVLETDIKLGFDKLTGNQRCLMLGEEVGELFKSVRKKII